MLLFDACTISTIFKSFSRFISLCKAQLGFGSEGRFAWNRSKNLKHFSIRRCSEKCSYVSEIASADEGLTSSLMTCFEHESSWRHFGSRFRFQFGFINTQLILPQNKLNKFSWQCCNWLTVISFAARPFSLPLAFSALSFLYLYRKRRAEAQEKLRLAILFREDELSSSRQKNIC